MHGCDNNCTAWSLQVDYPDYEPDPDIAGIGIITVFATSAFIILCLYVAFIVLRASTREDANSIDKWVYGAVESLALFHVRSESREFWVPIIEKVVLSISDQQLLTGLAVLVAGFWTHCSISVYHFAMVNDLAWFSGTAHLISLSVLLPYLRQPRHHVARNWRAILIGSLACLLVASSVMQGHGLWYESWSYDAQCLFEDLNGNISGEPKFWMSINLFWIIYSFPSAMICLYERPTNFFIRWLDEKPRNYLRKQILITKSGRHCGTFSIKRVLNALQLALLLLIQAIHRTLVAIQTSTIVDLLQNGFWFAYGMYGIVGDRDIPSSEMAGSENVMSFGQIVSIFLLGSTVFVFREAYDDQMSVLGKNSIPQYDIPQARVAESEVTSTTVSVRKEQFEMSGALSYSNDEDTSLPGSYRRVDTEAGGRLQNPSHEAGHPSQITLRRSTFPQSKNASHRASNAQ